MNRKRVVIMGAAGRDFHDFNVVYRDDPAYEVVAFTATQIPGIAGRQLPGRAAGPLYPAGIPIVPESELEHIVRVESVDLVVFAYSDVSHATVMHAASRAWPRAPISSCSARAATMLPSTRPVVAVGATRTGAGKSQTTRFLAALLAEHGLEPVVIRHPMPYGDLVAQRVQRYATHDDLARYETTIEEREEYEPHLDAGTHRLCRASTTAPSSPRPRKRPTSSCGTAATTTSPSTGPTCTWSWPIRCARAPSAAITRASERAHGRRAGHQQGRHGHADGGRAGAQAASRELNPRAEIVRAESRA